MALEQITFNIGAFNDADASGNNYFAGEVYEVFNTDNTLADIFSDAGGLTPINQDGISNKSNASGEVIFYIGAGSYYVLSGGKRRDFKSQTDINSRYNPDTLQDAINYTGWVTEGGEVFTVKEREAGKGGGARWETILTGSTAGVNLPDGFSIVQFVGVPTLAAKLHYEDRVTTSQLGSTLDQTLIQAAIDLGTPNVFVSSGEFSNSAPIILRSNLKLRFSTQTMLTPSTDGISLIETPAGSYVANGTTTENCTVHGFRFKMDGVSNCYGARVGNLRDNSGFFNAFGANDLNLVGPMDDRGNVGISYEILCWNTDLQNCQMRSGLNKGYEIRNGSNTVVVFNCRSNTHTTGIFISDGEYATENVMIVGGLFQRGVVNIDDRATHTVYNGPYVERPSVCDVNMDGASFPVINSIHHTGGEDAPSCGIKGRNVKGGQFKGVLNTASRSNGLYDFDASNSFCFAEQQRSETLGTVLGDITGLKMKQNWVAADSKEGDIGMLNNLIVGRQNAITVQLANNYNKVYLMPDFTISINAGFGIFKKNVSGDATFVISGAPVDGQSFKLVLFTAISLIANTITVDGRALDTSTATGGARVCSVVYTYISDLGRWVSSAVSWEAS